MKDRLSVPEKRVQRPKFIPCETDLLGGFDATGVRPDGSTCVAGMRTWWAYTEHKATERERVMGTCRCLKEWSRPA